MRKLFVFCSVCLLFVVGSHVQAGIYMGTKAAIPEKMPPKHDCVDKFGQPCEAQPLPTPGNMALKHAFSMTVYEGSLKNNVSRAIKMGKWKKLLWQLPYDYKWVGTMRMSADSLEELVAKLITQYPIQATFYKANQIVVIAPRKKYHV